MRTYICTNIVFDCDEDDLTVENLDLPTIVNVVVDQDLSGDELEEVLADAISDETGWCVEAFEYEQSVVD